MSSPTLPSPAEVPVCSSHVCCPTPVTQHQGLCTYWVFPASGFWFSITLPGSRNKLPGSWEASLAPVFHSRQWSNC